MRLIYRFSFAVVALIVAAIIGFVGIVGWAFWSGKNQIAEEWTAKMPRPRRTPSDMRGLVDNMVRYRHLTVPAFVPESGWDNEFCAAAIRNIVNFLLGEERLTTTQAWHFARVNADNLDLVYDRSNDFKIIEQSIVEVTDQGFSLTKLLKTVGEGDAVTSDRLYIVGYHYRNTRSDPMVIAAGGTMNTHLMLILGKYDGTWWGYHMLHDPAEPHESPFRIDSLGEQMPELFDLMYIWEMRDTVMPAKGTGTPLALVHNKPTYGSVSWRLGLFGAGSRGYFADTAITKLFRAGEQFPRVIDISQPLAEVRSPLNPYLGRWGDMLGFYRGVAVMRHRGNSKEGSYGREFQCVEFVNRFLAQVLGFPILRGTGNADSYYYGAKQKKLAPFANGGSASPQPDDILIFDADGPGKNPGHVGIVYRVSGREVCFVQQNMPRWRQCVPLVRKENSWFVSAIEPSLPCVGWARKEIKNEENPKTVVDPRPSVPHRRRRRR